MIFKNKPKGKKSGVKSDLSRFWNSESVPFKNMLSPVHLDIKSNREIVVEGCSGIEEYDENFVKIKVPKMAISFFGRNLEIKCMNVDSLVIEGFVTSIEFAT